MNGDSKSKDGDRFFRLVHRKIESQERARQTPEAEQAVQASGDLAERMLEVVDKTELMEDLIHCEIVLQTLDLLSATSQPDKTSVQNAQRDYRQLSATVAQMRENPGEYFRANVALRDTGGDFRKLPRGRIQHIHAKEPEIIYCQRDAMN